MKKDKVVNENVLEHEAVKPSVSDGENASVKDKKTMVSELSESSAKEMLVSIIDENEALKTENSALKKSCADVKTEADGYKDNWLPYCQQTCERTGLYFFLNSYQEQVISNKYHSKHLCEKYGIP